MNFVFGEAYGCPEGYTPLMAAAHRARLECCKALLRAGADPNFMNSASDLVLFWGIDGGVEIIKLLYEARGGRRGRGGHEGTPALPPSAAGSPWRPVGDQVTSLATDTSAACQTRPVRRRP